MNGVINAYNLGGLRLPASTGTDWWIYGQNRVFVQVDGAFRPLLDARQNQQTRMKRFGQA
jgi:hypothetical protein